jgi:anti-sigma factor RsiW
MRGEREIGGLLCSEVLADLTEYLDGRLDAARRASIEAHVAGCDNCARFGGDFGRVVASLRADLARAKDGAQGRDEELARRLTQDLAAKLRATGERDG